MASCVVAGDIDIARFTGLQIRCPSTCLHGVWVLTYVACVDDDGPHPLDKSAAREMGASMESKGLIRKQMPPIDWPTLPMSAMREARGYR